MIKTIHFSNFKALKDAELPLGPFTLLVGPNGSGKTTALQGILLAARGQAYAPSLLLSVGTKPDELSQVSLSWGDPWAAIRTFWRANGTRYHEPKHADRAKLAGIDRFLSQTKYYCLEARAICAPVGIAPHMQLTDQGGNLAGVLDQLRDHSPERFEALNDELGRWMPEFDRVLFDTPGQNLRSLLLRTREGGHSIHAPELSQGTLLALTMLTLAHMPEPPTILLLEEPDRGMHPRLLRDVRDSLYRLAYPDQYGEKRAPVQVIATTHSPYFLDLYRDHPEEVVLAEKEGNRAKFQRLSDRPDIEELLRDSHLGEVWYSGVLGGIPRNP